MPIAREKSRKQLMKQARAQIDEGLENQRVRGHRSSATSYILTACSTGGYGRAGSHQTLQGPATHLIRMPSRSSINFSSSLHYFEVLAGSSLRRAGLYGPYTNLTPL